MKNLDKAGMSLFTGLDRGGGGGGRTSSHIHALSNLMM